MSATAACCRLTVVGLAVRLQRLRLVYKLLLLAAICLWVLLPLWQAAAASIYSAKRSCYIQPPNPSVPAASAAWLPDLLSASRQPRPDRTLFFVDAQCRRPGADHHHLLTSRQACAIESAARAHPQWDVFVLFAAPVSTFAVAEQRSAGGDPEAPAELRVDASPLAAVLQLPNVHWRTVNLWQLADNTSLAEWLHEDEAQLFGRPDAAQQLAQLVRWLALQRYGGVLIGWDVLVRRSLDELGGAGNWAALAAADSGEVRADVMRVTKESGRLVGFLLHEFRRRIDGGDGEVDAALNALVRTVCGATTGNGLVEGDCGGQFGVLPAAHFYAVPVADWTALLNARQAYYVSELVRDAYAVKLWADRSGRELVRRVRRAQEAVPLMWLAEQHCPAAWAASGGFF